VGPVESPRLADSGGRGIDDGLAAILTSRSNPNL